MTRHTPLIFCLFLGALGCDARPAGITPPPAPGATAKTAQVSDVAIPATPPSLSPETGPAPVIDDGKRGIVEGPFPNDPNRRSQPTIDLPPPTPPSVPQGNGDSDGPAGAIVPSRSPLLKTPSASEKTDAAGSTAADPAASPQPSTPGGATTAVPPTSPVGNVVDQRTGAQTTAPQPGTTAEPTSPGNPPVKDGPPVRKPPQNRAPRRPGEPLPISFDILILGMKADMVFRDFMLSEEVRELDGQKIELGGYMNPFADARVKSTEFILLRNTECKFGPGGQADHLARIFLKQGARIGYSVKPITVVGTLRITPFVGEDGNTWSIYDIEQAEVK